MIDKALDSDNVLREARSLLDNVQIDQVGSENRDKVARAVDLLKESVQSQAVAADHSDPKDESVYMPTDAPLSLLQSLSEEQMRATGALPSADGPLASATTIHPATSTELFPEPFSDRDPRWAEVTMVQIANYLDRSNDYRRPVAPPALYELEQDSTLVLVSDWGTGEEAAREVADQMKLEIARARRENRAVHVIHLGDVYYAGTQSEAEERFLDIWPVHDDSDDGIHSWCLNGNHDMYSGGAGLIDVILEDPRFSAQRTTEPGQKTSEFHLENEHWQVLGLDTAVAPGAHDWWGLKGNLSEDQAAWLRNRVDGSDVRTMLLTHHQPLSRSEEGLETPGNLLARTASVLSRVDAWFWGHEHRLLTYGTKYGVKYCACIGNGAVPTPVGVKAAKSDEGEWEYMDAFTKGDHDWRLSGFATVDLSIGGASVRYINQKGDTVRSDEVSR